MSNLVTLLAFVDITAIANARCLRSVEILLLLYLCSAYHIGCIRDSLHICVQGKFVRIHFGTNGKIAGADIETCKYYWRITLCHRYEYQHYFC